MLTTLFLLHKRLAYLLAGKDTAAKKIQTARTKYEAEILNLRRLDKLLRGQLTFDQVKQQDKLTSMNKILGQGIAWGPHFKMFVCMVVGKRLSPFASMLSANCC